MKNFVIVTDCNADLYEGYYEENPTPMLQFTFSIDGVEYSNEDYPLNDYYDVLASGKMVKTSQINQHEATTELEKLLDRGENILYLSFSSGMSGSFDNISYVINGLKQKYPNQRIEIVDTLSGGGGEGLLVYKAKQMQENGKSMDEIIEWVEQNRTRSHHIFIVNDLANLKHSGRISTIGALMGNLMKIKPILEITKDGKVGVLAKAMGRKKAVGEIVKFFKDYYIADDNDFILIGHTNRMDEAEFLAEKIREVAGDKPIKFGCINRLVSGNAGYNSLVIYFFGKERLTMGS